MSLQAILDAIHESGEAQVREIEANAHAQSQEILRRAQDEAARLREEARLSMVAPAARDGIRVMRQAQHQALQIIVGAYEALVDMAFQRTRESLAQMRSDPAYPSLFSRLTEEALAELRQSLTDDRRIRLEVDPRDRALLEPMVRGLGFVVSYTLNCWGGLIASSHDGRIVVFNTLEARLERATPYLRRHLAARFNNAELAEVDIEQQVTSAEA